VRCGPTSATISVRLFCVSATSTVEGQCSLRCFDGIFLTSSLVVFCASRWLLVSTVCDHISIPSW
jgi:hypothetical protein